MRRLKLGLIWLVFVVLLLGVDQAHGALTFKSEAQVAGEYITLSNLADLPLELAEKCGSAPVWSAPPPGRGLHPDPGISEVPADGTGVGQLPGGGGHAPGHTGTANRGAPEE
jgi:hypothetical protein